MFQECCSRLIARHRISVALSLEDQDESQYTPSTCRFQAGIVGNRSFRNRENIGRSNSQSCAAKMAAFPVSGGIAARGALFLNGGTLEIASVSTEVNSIVPYLCAVYSRVNVPGKIPVLVHKYAIEIFRGRHFLED